MRARNQHSLRTQLLAQRAHAMRKQLTELEARLWSAIRGKRLGTAFRRQKVVGEFIVDFVAPAVRFVVEVDGGYHVARAKADARRDGALGRLGYRVVRVPAELVMADLQATTAVVRAALEWASAQG